MILDVVGKRKLAGPCVIIDSDQYIRETMHVLVIILAQLKILQQPSVSDGAMCFINCHKLNTIF